MHYVISDIHGRIDLFDKMLDKINLQKGDILYVLGDCIDRGGGLEVALKLADLKQKGLVKFIMGNHELIFLENLKKHRSNKRVANDLFEIEKIVDKSKKIQERQKKYSENPNIAALIGSVFNVIDSFSSFDIMNKYRDEIQNSLSSVRDCARYEEADTWSSLSSLSDEQVDDIIDLFTQNNTYYQVIEIDGKQYFLVHGGLTDDTIKNMFIRDDFYKNPINRELLPKYLASQNCTVIFGHTTTRDINIELNGTYIAPNKIWFDTVNNDKIGIDCGASFPNGQLACLRLEDMKEFYVKNEDRFIVNPDRLTKKFQEPIELFNNLYPELIKAYSEDSVYEK